MLFVHQDSIRRRNSSMGRLAAGPPGRWYLGPNLLSKAPKDTVLPYPGALPCDPGLSLVVLDRGAHLGRSGPWELRRFGDSLFPVSAGGRVWRPMSSPFPFLQIWAEDGLRTSRGHVYLWAGLCASEDEVSGPSALYSDFEEWVWGEAVRVDSGELARADGRPARYHLHRWSGGYFVSVDPRPTPFRSFETRGGALMHAVQLVQSSR